MIHNIFRKKEDYIFWQTCTEYMHTYIHTIGTDSAKDLT